MFSENLNDDVKEILLSEEEIKTITKRLGEQISKEYEGKNLLLVSVLKGSVVFMADLMRAITVPCSIDFMVVSSLIDILKMRKPNSVKICTFLDKPERRLAPIEADYVGARVPDEFVVGYGLDYNERYRNLPYVGVLKPSVYSDLLT